MSKEVEERVLAARSRLEAALKEVALAKRELEIAHLDRYTDGRFYIVRWEKNGDNYRRWNAPKLPPPKPEDMWFQVIWEDDPRNSRKSFGLTNKVPGWKPEEASIGNGLYKDHRRTRSRWRTKTTIYDSMAKLIDGMNRLGVPALLAEQFIMRFNALQQPKEENKV